MLIDFREFNSTDPIKCDICIIGGGAAGITIAKSLAGSSVNVVLLESGGLDLDADIQYLAEYNNIGDYFQEVCRLRLLGGSTNHWGGASAPFSEFDMSKRSWVNDSGWPIDRQELEPYYQASHALLELGDYEYKYPLSTKDEWLPQYSNGLNNRFYRSRVPPINFGTDFREELGAAKNVRIIYNAIATNIDANETADAVNSISFQSFEGKSGQVFAKAYVLSVGAMETPRLLLLSNDIQPEGLGNGSDMVGRYFMMHPHSYIGTLTYDSLEFASQLIRQRDENVQLIGIVGLSEKTQISNKLLAGSVQLIPLLDPDSGLAAARRIKNDLQNTEWPDQFGSDLWRVLTDFDSVVAGNDGNITPSGDAKIWVQSEQSPNPDSRVILDKERDDLGMQKLAVDCRLQDIDHQTIQKLGKLYGSEAARLGFGRVKLDPWVDSDTMTWPEELESGCHHLGGARMSTNPTKGVVDENCRVHGIDNLYIASSAVFPTGSDVNPTITIVALSLRLTDHLKKVIPA